MNLQYTSKTSFQIKNSLSISLKDIYEDKSNLSLFLSNILIIFLAFYYKWDFSELLWIYFFQSLIVGVFQLIKIVDLKKFSIKGIQFNIKLENPILIKYYLLLFFIINYGIFHMVYYFFIKYVYGLGISDFYPIVTSCIIFFINHLYSFLMNRSIDRVKRRNLGEMVNLAYLRVYPMHFTLILGGIISKIYENNQYKTILMVFFLFLKAITDSITHKYEHNIKEDLD